MLRPDQLLNEAMARESLQLCDDGHLQSFESAGHWIQHDQDTEINYLLSSLANHDVMTRLCSLISSGRATSIQEGNENVV